MTEADFFDFHQLSKAPYGAYAVDLSQTILFWNRSAERILGHTADDVIGLRCYEVLQSLPENGAAPVCMKGCPAILDARAGRVPPTVHVIARCSSGRRKPITVTSLVVPQVFGDRTVIAHLFHERTEDARSGTIAESVHEALSGGRPLGGPPDSTADPGHGKTDQLTPRELEVLRLTALDMKTGEIARELNLSYHTVRNYVHSAREKLGAKSKLSAVLLAQRHGLI